MSKQQILKKQILIIQPQKTLKQCEDTCNKLIKDIKQQYKKKKVYRKTIFDTQRLINKLNTQFSVFRFQICASLLLKILLLQSKSIIKLLKRNINKKYLYQQFRVKALLKILNRNNIQCHMLLVNKIQSKQILNQNQDGFFMPDKQKAEINNFKDNYPDYEFRKLVKIYSEIYLESIEFGIVNFATYNFNLIDNAKWSRNLLDHMIVISQKCNKFSLKHEFLSIQTKLLICKILFEKKDLYQQSLKMVNIIIENLLVLHSKIKSWGDKNIFQNQQHTKLTKQLKDLKKIKQYMKRVFKLLLISIILMVRINMKANKQTMVIQGIKIFNFIYQKLTSTDLLTFKKYLNPQIYLYQQYYQYRAQKYQILQIIQPLFNESCLSITQKLKNQIQQTNNKNIFVQENKNCILNFYNDKMTEFNNKMNNQQLKQINKKIKKKKFKAGNLQELSSNVELGNKYNLLKSKQSKRCNNNARQAKNKTLYNSTSSTINYNKNNSSSDHGKKTSFDLQRNSLNPLQNLQNFIFQQIQKQNNNYLTQRKHQSSHNKSSKQGSNFLLSFFNSQTHRVSGNKGEINANIINNQSNKHLNLAKNLISNVLQSNKSTQKKYILVSNKVKKKNHITINNNDTEQSSKNSKTDKQNIFQKNTPIIQVAQKIKAKDAQVINQVKRNIQLLKQKRTPKYSQLNKFERGSHYLLYNNINKKKLIQNQIIQDQQINNFLDSTNNQKNQIQKTQYDSKNISYGENRNSYMNVSNRYKDKLKHLNKKSKTQLFIELLIKNKEYLGVKKWTQKVQYLKKKEQLRIKLRSTRKTTSITYNRVPGLSNNIFNIAGDILQFSLSQIQQYGSSGINALNTFSSPNHPRTAMSKSTAKLCNQNNYKIGQKSIQILMNKLQKQKQSIIQNDKNKKKKPITLYNHLIQNEYETKQIQTQKQGKQALKTNRQLHNSKSSYITKSNKNRWLCKFVL